MRIKKSFLWMILLIIIISGVAYIFIGSGNNKEIINVDNSQVQLVKLKTSGSSYVLEPSTVKKGVPVRIEADMSKMPGCSKSIAIQAFGVRKVVSQSNNIIEFTPNKIGTFTIACSMNMYRGSFTVTE